MKFTATQQELIDKILKGKKNIKVTIAMNQLGVQTVRTYDTHGLYTENDLFRYEIGSLTKLFTAALLAKSLGEDLLHLESSLSCILKPLDPIRPYPSIKELATHTSGYASPLPFNRLHQYKTYLGMILGRRSAFENPYHHKTSYSAMLRAIENIDLRKQDYPFAYANINYSLLGAMLARVYQMPFTSVMQTYIDKDLKLRNTSFSSKDVLPGFSKYSKRQGNWQWDAQDSGIASGGLYSSALDLLEFSRFVRSSRHAYLDLCRQTLAKGTESYDAALGWKVCTEAPIFWHDGGTGCFNSFLGYHRDAKVELCILSNYRSRVVETLGLSILKALV